MLSDLGGQLLFPRIFRAGAAAARPERLAAGGLMVLVAGGAAMWLPRADDGAGLLGRLMLMLDLVTDGLAGAALRLDLFDLHQRVRLLLLETPRQMFEDGLVSSALLLLVLAAVWALGGVFIARSAGMELGRRIHLRAGRSLGFVRIKGPAALAGVLLTPVLALVLLAVPAVLGLLLSAPGLDLLGAVLHGLGLVAGLAAALLLLAWLAAFWLIVPAVACDGADAFDATQRSMGMFLNRPVSVGFHMLLALAQGIVLVAVVWTVADLGTSMAAWAGGLFSERARAVIGAAGWVDAGGPGMPAVSIISLWHALPTLLSLAYAVSYAHTASVAVYLNARQIVDGQEPNEIWMPGDPSGVTGGGVSPAAGPGGEPSGGDRGSA